jgi:hypothetical protein
MESKERGISTFRALSIICVVFLTALTLVVYLILGIMSLLMALFPWAP